MTARRWWDLIVAAAGAGLVTLLVLDPPPDPVRWWTGLAGLVVVAGGWFAFGRRAHAPDPGRSTLALHLAVIVGAGLAVTGNPVLATVQAIGYPILWTTSPTRARAIAASTALAASVAAGFFVALGPTRDTAISAAISAGLALAFAVAMGLWITAISEESAARQALLTELTATQAALAAASRDAGAAAERERLARDVHDTVAQDLTGIVMGLRRLPRVSGAEAARFIDDLSSLAEDALADARALVDATAAPALAAGLPAALRRLTERFARESTATAVTTIGDLPALPREHEVVLLRIAQESLANTRKHARAGAVSVALSADDGAVVLRVADDGVGFDPAAAPAGFGLPGMRERLALVGGSLRVASGPSGTTVVAELPAGAPVTGDLPAGVPLGGDVSAVSEVAP